MTGMNTESAMGSEMFTDENANVEDAHDSTSDNGDISDSDGESEESNEEDNEERNANCTNEQQMDVFKIDSVVELEEIGFSSMTANEVHLYHFSSLHVAFKFYSKYVEKKGFPTRKWNTVVNKKGDVTQQTFVCFKEGYRLKKHLIRKDRKREARAMTRCGCNAFFRVRKDVGTGRWHVKAFVDDHIHELLVEKFVGMLPIHRKMHECDINQMNSMRDAGWPLGNGTCIMKLKDKGGSRFRRRCMLGDYDVGRFRTKWEELIMEFELQGVRGCILRQRELEADFESIVGEPVLVTPFEDIERCTTRIYTRKVFLIFRSVLEKSSNVKVVSCEQTPNCWIYIVCKRAFPTHQWYVSLVHPGVELKCSCLRMESMGIPCEHAIVVLHYLEIRDCLILFSMWRSQVMGLLFDCYDVCKLAGTSVSSLELSKQYVKELLQKLRESSHPINEERANPSDEDDVSVRDPTRVRSKGCGSRNNAGYAGRRNRRTTCCSICQAPGHNKKTCPMRRVNDDGGPSNNREDV
ncbi:Zinc finger, PMZ-type [Sesbania bispinosa]|nr:Zinc finger, PMZ-type [Sesbania bispinosa]